MDMNGEQGNRLVDMKNKRIQELLDALCDGVIDLETYKRAVDAVYSARSEREISEVVNAIFEEKQLSPF
jgi:uncharacterized UPF0146 family protein